MSRANNHNRVRVDDDEEEDSSDEQGSVDGQMKMKKHPYPGAALRVVDDWLGSFGRYIKEADFGLIQLELERMEMEL